MALELQPVRGSTYCLRGPVNVGVYDRGDGSCLLIDSGLDESSGRKVLRILKDAGLTPAAVINTHSHADHCGADWFIRKRTGAAVYTSRLERAFIEHPALETFYLFSAVPPREMRTKFLMAQPCPVDGVLAPGVQEVAGVELEVLDLAGHSPGQIGVATPDDVLFAADAFFSTNVIEKYRLPYTADVGAALETIAKLEETAYACYVPGHGEPVEDPREALAANRAVTESIAGLVVEIAGRDGRAREEIMKEIVRRKEITLHPEQYLLVFATVSAYLGHLADTGRLQTRYGDGELLWAAAG